MNKLNILAKEEFDTIILGIVEHAFSFSPDRSMQKNELSRMLSDIILSYLGSEIVNTKIAARERGIILTKKKVDDWARNTIDRFLGAIKATTYNELAITIQSSFATAESHS